MAFRRRGTRPLYGYGEHHLADRRAFGWPSQTTGLIDELDQIQLLGYGKSGGSPSEHGLYRDAAAAYQYLLDRGYSARQIILQGESLGTAVAVDLASRKDCAGIVLEAAFTSGRDVANTVLPVIGPLLFRGLDSKSKIAKVR